MAADGPGAARLRDVVVNGARLSLREWGRAGMPQMVLLPGTGLAAAIFAEAEALLAEQWHGFSLDRRGQGLSERPVTGYEFGDFADDLVALAAELELEGAAGIGHSAGGTDLLLAAAREPGRWSRIAAIEPTVQDPRKPPLPETDPPSWQESYERMMRRRAGFDSLDLAVERFRTNPGFARCDETRLRAYLAEALEQGEDGEWRLRCTRPVEAQMNRHIMQAMHHRYPAGEIFAPLLAMTTPARVVTMGQSGEIYGAMAKIAIEVIPGAEHEHLPDFGHILPLESPRAIARLAGSVRGAR